MKLLCNSQNAYKWNFSRNVYFRGYFFLEDNLYFGEDAVNYLCEKSQEEVVLKLPDFNGIFSIVIDYGSTLLMACDRLRGLPIFYSVTDHNLIISDLVKSILHEMSTVKVNALSYDDYASSSLFVSSYDTLIEGVFQVQAAEYVLIDTQSLEIERHEYFHYKSNIDENATEEQLKKGFFKNYREIGQRLVRTLRGRTAVVPLSGGADSRMIVSMLKEQGYQDVICYTYGIRGNSESKISKEVAEHYGYPWYMVEYNAAMWDELQRSDVFNAYDEYASNYVSTTHIQDFLAIVYLKDHHIIPDDSVFVPGHSGDLIAGSHLTDDFLRGDMDFDRYFKRVLTKFYPKGHSKALEEKIRYRFPHDDSTDIETFSREFEWFNVKERQAKFIVNSVRAYEFIGHEWLVPLWDNSQFEFWSTVPIALRYNRTLYFDCVHDGIKSTNDKTATTELADRIRKMPFLNNTVRRICRIKKYYTSKFGIEHMFSFKEYMSACLTMRSTFTVNDLLCERKLKQLRKASNTKD